MTAREAYVFGWIFGSIVRASGDSRIGGDVTLAAQRPYTANAKVISAAQREGLLNGDLDRQIAEAMMEITSFPDESPEPYLPLELQGSWQVGYYHAKAGKPLGGEAFDIAAARRAKGMTQSQLANKLGVNQAVISRWESGKVSPNEDSLKRIKETLK